MNENDLTEEPIEGGFNAIETFKEAYESGEHKAIDKAYTRLLSTFNPDRKAVDSLLSPENYALHKGSFNGLEEFAKRPKVNFDYHGLSIPTGDLTILAGYTNHGKSRVAIDLAFRIATGQGTGQPALEGKVAYITAEQDLPTMLAYMYRRTKKENVSQNSFNTGQYDGSLENPVDFVDGSSVTPLTKEAIVGCIDRLVTVEGYRAVFLDFIQLVDKEDKYQETRLHFREVAKELQLIANKNAVAIIATAQTNKEASKDFMALGTTNIAESVDIARNAGYIVGLFKLERQVDKGAKAAALEKRCEEWNIDKRKEALVMRELKTRDNGLVSPFTQERLGWRGVVLVKFHYDYCFSEDAHVLDIDELGKKEKEAKAANKGKPVVKNEY